MGKPGRRKPGPEDESARLERLLVYRHAHAMELVGPGVVDPRLAEMIEAEIELVKKWSRDSAQ
jgi:hypothetical protein